MAKKRYINTKFWSDNYISDLDPIEKLLFIYFLTNPYTDICGVYEISLKQIALDTGIDKQEMLPKMIARFSRDKKIHYLDGWIYVKNFAKHQAVNDKIQIGIERSLKEVPEQVLASIKQLEIDYDSLSKPTDNRDRDLNSNLNLNLNLNLNSNASEVDKSLHKEVIKHFFELKGWGDKGKDFYSQNKIVYARFIKPAKELIELCENNLEEAKECLDKISKWAISRELEWGIETVFKKWYDIDLLKEKERKPFIEGQRAFQKLNKWYLIDRTGEIKEYVGSLSKIEYK